MRNITIIPFLLGTMIPDDMKLDADPEYTFQINKTTAVFMDISLSENVTAMVTCHLNYSSMENILYCHANKIFLSKLTQKTYENIKDGKAGDANFIPRISVFKLPDRVFELEFGIQGVQGVKVQGEKLYSYPYNIIPDIIDQLNMGIDLSNKENSMKNYETEISGAHVISSFTQIDEGTMRASKCNASLKITYIPSNHFHKDGEHQDYKTKLESDFLLRLLPITYTNPVDKTFLIERRRKACIAGPRNIKFQNDKWEINNFTQYYNVMELRRTKPKFTSRTYLEGYVLRPLKDRAHYFWEDVRLDLHNIKFFKKDSREYKIIMMK